MNQAGIDSSFSPARSAALLKEETTGGPAGAMVLADGRVVTGKIPAFPAGCLCERAQSLGVDDDIYVISDDVIKPICTLKTSTLHSKNRACTQTGPFSRSRLSSATDPLIASRPRGRPARMRRLLQRGPLRHRRGLISHLGHQRLLQAEIRAAPLLPQVRRLQESQRQPQGFLRIRRHPTDNESPAKSRVCGRFLFPFPCPAARPILSSCTRSG